MDRKLEIGPEVRVEEVSRKAGTPPHGWVIGWRIGNLSDQRMRIQAARLPHGRFRSEELGLDPAKDVSPGSSAVVELPVACRERPGVVVENAFLILRVLWSERSWRILARFRVVFDEKGGPTTTTEAVTTHPVGFSVRA